MAMSESEAVASIISAEEGPVAPEMSHSPGPMAGAHPRQLQRWSWEAASCPTPPSWAPLTLLVTHPWGATSGRVPPRDSHRTCHCV